MRAPMGSLWSCYTRLPRPLRIVLGLGAAGGALYGAWYFLGSYFRGADRIFYIAGAAVLLLLLLSHLALHGLLKWRERRKGEGLGKDVGAHGTVVPQAVTRASQRARLDDLRGKFEEGIRKFRAAGKNLYSLPWYVFVGEPGAGKTEAIRHSNVGFPPGLHDPLQGAGGTINMNWWFTDRAVVLDTAGQVAFDEVPAGTTSEWDEFLRLLRVYRRDCPLNGIVLVIPADTLVTDTADAITRKAEKIAEQLHKMQRVLRKRFPIFVLITKTDRIAGFREFFEDMTDPRHTSQMLGWSNPAALDERFQPEHVEEHLRVVRHRLRRRRLALLADPVPTEDPNARRIDQVDMLYAFPGALQRITSRLQQYLTTVFAGGEWTGKPHFLRGIYFTSAMREGSALDDGLAGALGVAVESLPDDRVWDREASYFLTDVFLEKMFKERNLVSGATYINRRRRMAKAMIAVAGLASVAALALYTWFGAKVLHERIGTHHDHWVAAADSANWARHEETRGGKKVRHPDYWKPIVAPEGKRAASFVYNTSLIRVGADEGEPLAAIGIGAKRKGTPVARFHEELGQLAAKPITVPRIFFVSKFLFPRFRRADLTHKRIEAQRLLFEAGVLRPALDAARGRMRSLGGASTWPRQATPALVQLVRLEAPRCKLCELDPLFELVLHREGTAGKDNKHLAEYRADAKALKKALGWIYSPGGAPWPPKAAHVGTGEAHQTIRRGVDGFVRHWERWLKGDKASREALQRIRNLARLFMSTYADAEKRLLDVDDDFGAQRPAVGEDAAAAWRARLAGLRQAQSLAERDLAAFADESSIRAVFDRVTNDRLDEVQKAFDQFRASAWIRRALAEPQTARNARWKALCQELDGRLRTAIEGLRRAAWPAGLDVDIATLDARFLHRVDVGRGLWPLWVSLTGEGRLGQPRPLRLYQVRLMMYLLADRERASTDEDIRGMGTLRAAVAAIAKKLGGAQAKVRKLAGVPSEDHRYRIKDATDVSDFVCKRLARPYRICLELEHRLAKAPRNPGEVAERTARRARAHPPLAKPGIPLTDVAAGHFEPKYHPQAFLEMLREYRSIGEDLETVLEEEKGIDPARRDRFRAAAKGWRAACDGYLRDQYYPYWSQAAIRYRLAEPRDWQAFRQRLREIASSDAVLDALGRIGEAAIGALSGEITKLVSGDALRTLQAFDRDGLATSVAQLKDKAYRARCRDLLAVWRALDADPSEAYRTMASSKGDRAKTYLPTSRRGFAHHYWDELTREGLRLLVEHRLRTAPTDDDEVANEAAQRARAHPPIPRPGIPLTDITPGRFDPRYHPHAILDMVRECRGAGDDLDRVLEDEPADSPRRRALRGAWTRWQGAIERYVRTRYCAYWSDVVPRYHLERAPDWRAFRHKLDRIGASDAVVDALQRTAKAVEDAVSGEVKGLAAAGDIRERLKLAELDSQLHREKCRSVLSRWRALDADPLRAYSRMLASKKDGSVTARYFPFSGMDFPHRYWAELSREGLHHLVGAVYAEARRMLHELTARYGVFPLDVPRQDERQLAPGQIGGARAMVDGLMFVRRSLAAFRGSGLEPELRELVALGPSDAEWEWVDRARRVLEFLPSERHYVCEIWIRDADRQVAEVWALQGEKSAGSPYRQGAPLPYKVGTVTCPGEPVGLRFRGPAIGGSGLDLPGPWAVLRLLHAGMTTDRTLFWRQETPGRCVAQSRGPVRFGDVRMTIQRGGPPPTVGLQLVFHTTKTLPSAWPALTRAPALPTRCPAVRTRCPAQVTACRALRTRCPEQETVCPTSRTRCPEQETVCPAFRTRCQERETVCPAFHTRCPERATVCPTPCVRAPTRLPAGGLLVGLMWRTATNVDLHIVEPGGERCGPDHRRTRSGGQLLNDAVRGPAREVYVHPEPPPGPYQIWVTFTSGGVPTPVTIQVGRDRRLLGSHTTTLTRRGERRLIDTIRIGRGVGEPGPRPR